MTWTESGIVTASNNRARYETFSALFSASCRPLSRPTPGAFVETTMECFHVSGIPETWKSPSPFESRLKRQSASVLLGKTGGGLATLKL